VEIADRFEIYKEKNNYKLMSAMLR
jgi:hypothetical protein